MTALIETMRVRGGVAPLRLDHLARLALSCTALDLPLPAPADGDTIDAAARRLKNGVLRVRWDGAAVTTSGRAEDVAPVRLRTVRVVHRPYPHKTEDRAVFEAAAHEAAPAEPLLLTAAQAVAETARFAVLWIDEGRLCAVDRAVGVLPSIGVDRVHELDVMSFRRLNRFALAGLPLAVVNAVRGVVPVETLDGERVPGDSRWQALQAEFWSA